MKLNRILVVIFIVNLTACTLSPAQKATWAEKRLRAEQSLQVNLAKQCDVETANLMAEQFNLPLSRTDLLLRTDKEQKQFEQRYVEKVNNPMFQACYKLAWQNYKAQEEIRQMRYDYDRDYRFSFGRICYFCW